MFRYTILFIIFVFGCATNSKSKHKRRCYNFHGANYSNILHVKIDSITKQNDTITFNEVRYECVNTSFLTKKVMYDKFGKWDKVINIEGRDHPILVWTNKDLFNNGEKYTVLTYGIEEYYYMYASVMVFSPKNVDLLSNSSSQKLTLTKYFSDLIKSNDVKNTLFYEDYWKMVYPKRWIKIKINKLKRQQN